MPGLVSIATPIFNTARFLPAALDSLLAQDYPHWECLLWDDGSTDGSGAVAAAYAARDPRFRVLGDGHNPYGGRHAYVLHADDPTDRLPWGTPLQARKVLHVSPFCQPSGRYRFRFMRTASPSEPGERLLARVDHDDESGQPLLRTSWSGQLQPLTHRALWWACAAMPLQSLSVVARIHWHALRLWLKHVPIYTHPRHV